MRSPEYLRSLDDRLPDNLWGPATVFSKPLGRGEPMIIHQDGTGFGEGMRARIFREVWQDEQIRKYTRGHCHEYAAACIEEHGGKIVSLMSKGRVAHVIAQHDFPDGRILRDITGDWIHDDHETLRPKDFGLISEVWLLGCPIDEVIVTELHPWSLPCLPPDPEEVAIARRLTSVRQAPEWPEMFSAEPVPDKVPTLG